MISKKENYANMEYDINNCCQKGILAGYIEKMLGLENGFVHMARGSVLECMT